MIWPLGYLIIFTALFLLSRRLPLAWLLAAAVLAFSAQVVDLRGGWRNLYVGPDRIGTTWQTALVSPLWSALAPHYQRVRALPVVEVGANWRDLSYFAVNHRLATDAVHLGRVDAGALAAAIARGEQALLDGSFDPGAIYALDEASATKAIGHLRGDDLLVRVDGLVVFARGGRSVLESAGIAIAPFDPAPPGG